MQKLSIQLSGKERVEFILPHTKILFGDNHALIFKIFMALEEHFSKGTSTEYAKEHYLERNVYWDDFPISPRECFLFRIDPYFDFYADMKMGSTSLLHRYAETLLADLPYEDNFSTLATAYQFLENETIRETLAVDCDSLRLTFELEPLTPKLLLKLLSGRMMKDECESGRYDLTRSESIRLQLALIRRMVVATDKRALVLYDGPLDSEGLTPFALPDQENIQAQITCLLATTSPHIPMDLASYAVMGRKAVDLADWSSVEHMIGMDLSWHWDEPSLREDFRRYIAGECDEKSLYLKKVLSNYVNTSVPVQ